MSDTNEQSGHRDEKAELLASLEAMSTSEDPSLHALTQSVEELLPPDKDGIVLSDSAQHDSETDEDNHMPESARERARRERNHANDASTDTDGDDCVRMVVLYDYKPDPSSKGELELQAGDVVLVYLSDQREDDPWWFGEIESDGRCGYFPAAWVEREDEYDEDECEDADEVERRNEDKIAAALSAQQQPVEAPSREEKPPVSSRGGSQVMACEADDEWPRALVLHDFNPTAPDEMSLRLGEVIEVYEQDESGWYFFVMHRVGRLTPWMHVGGLEHTERSDSVSSLRPASRCYLKNRASASNQWAMSNVRDPMITFLANAGQLTLICVAEKMINLVVEELIGKNQLERTPKSATKNAPISVFLSEVEEEMAKARAKAAKEQKKKLKKEKEKDKSKDKHKEKKTKDKEKDKDKEEKKEKKEKKVKGSRLVKLLGKQKNENGDGSGDSLRTSPSKDNTIGRKLSSSSITPRKESESVPPGEKRRASSISGDRDRITEHASASPSKRRSESVAAFLEAKSAANQPVSSLLPKKKTPSSAPYVSGTGGAAIIPSPAPQAVRDLLEREKREQRKKKRGSWLLGGRDESGQVRIRSPPSST